MKKEKSKNKLAKNKPNYRLKPIKSDKNNDPEIMLIANVQNGKCLNRRDFIWKGGALLAVLGIAPVFSGCGDDDEKKPSSCQGVGNSCVSNSCGCVGYVFCTCVGYAVCPCVGKSCLCQYNW